MRNGFFRVAACVPPVRVADVRANAEAIIDMLRQLDRKGVELAVFPELCVTGYTCGDLFHNDLLLEAAGDAVREIADVTKTMRVNAVIGSPMLFDNRLYNCAIVVGQGMTKLTVPKTYLPNYNEFYERRLWSPAPRVPDSDESQMPVSANKLFQVNGVKVGIEICEDLWVPVPPSCHAALAGAKVIVNLSASPDIIGKYDYLRDLIAQQSARCVCGYVYAAAGFGESSTDLVFDGKGIIAENGRILAATPRWQESPQMVICDIDIEMITRDRLHIGTFAECGDRENAGVAYPVVQQINLNLSELLDPDSNESLREKLDKIMGSDDSSEGSDDDAPGLLRTVDPHPFVPWDDNEIDRRCDEIINIQVAGLAQRLKATGCKCLVVGISGGLDSTLALLVATRAFDRLKLDRKGIIGVTMPGFGTTGRTHSNALTLMDALGVTFREIPIGPAVELHFKDIGHDPEVKDVTYENCQARERTQILMDVANQEGGMVLGTGDLSELALGWATYNGDHMSMYGVNGSIPKTLVKYLVNWVALNGMDNESRITLLDIVDTPISPELIPADENGNIKQKTEDLVGPYELHDFFLYQFLRFGFRPAKIFFLASIAFRDTYDEETIKKWLTIFCRRFFQQQFKRSCLPDGPKVGSVSLSPRGDWRMPSDASAASWLKECEEL